MGIISYIRKVKPWERVRTSVLINSKMYEAIGKRIGLNPITLFSPHVGFHRLLWLGMNAVLMIFWVSAIGSVKGGEMNVEPTTGVDSIKMSDVIGINEFRSELEEILSFIKDKEKFKKAGAELPRGVLLYGAPGVGKTMLAKALASEAGVKLYYKSAAEFSSSYLGLGAKMVKQFFTEARKNSPSIIFLDEIDAIAKKRDYKGYSRTDHTLNQLLVELDGFDKNEDVIIIAATNNAQGLDPAIMRPGRFDKLIRIPKPKVAAREKLLEYYLSKIPTSPELSREGLLERTEKFTGADFKSMVNQAAILAVRRGHPKVTDEDISSSIDIIQQGIKQVKFESDSEKMKREALGRAGEVVFQAQARAADKNPKNFKLVRKAFEAQVDSKTVKEIQQSIDGMICCRAAESSFYGDSLSLNCVENMRIASDYAKKLVDAFPTVQEHLSQNLSSSTDSTFKNLKERCAEELIRQRFEKLRDVFAHNQDVVLQIARVLASAGKIEREAVYSILQDKKLFNN